MNILERVYIAVFKKGKEEIYTRKLMKVTPPDLYPLLDDHSIHFKHSGLIGDIIYAIPVMKALAGKRDIYLHLLINQPSLYKKGMKHYNKDKILTEKSVELIAPLILSQPGFKSCDTLVDQRVDYDLDYFRKFPFDYNSNHICRWYFHMYGVSMDLSQPWLTVTSDPALKNEILIARSFRYRAPGISYGFLQEYPNISFVGLKEEYEDLKLQIPGLKYRTVNDFLELTKLIAGCKFFIGNQSFPFAVAEALKVKRVLELCFECPNVIPEGKDAYDFCYQGPFEKIVRELDTRQSQ